MNEIYTWPANDYRNYLAHHGILGMKWGIRRFQNPDGSLTEEGRARYREINGKYEKIHGGKLYYLEDESGNKVGWTRTGGETKTERKIYNKVYSDWSRAGNRFRPYIGEQTYNPEYITATRNSLARELAKSEMIKNAVTQDMMYCAAKVIKATDPETGDGKLVGRDVDVLIETADRDITKIVRPDKVDTVFGVDCLTALTFAASNKFGFGEVRELADKKIELGKRVEADMELKRNKDNLSLKEQNRIKKDVEEFTKVRDEFEQKSKKCLRDADAFIKDYERKKSPAADKATMMNDAKTKGLYNIDFLEKVQNDAVLHKGGKDLLNEYSKFLDDPDGYMKNFKESSYQKRYKNTPEVREAMRIAKAEGWDALTSRQKELLNELD